MSYESKILSLFNKISGNRNRPSRKNRKPKQKSRQSQPQAQMLKLSFRQRSKRKLGVEIGHEFCAKTFSVKISAKRLIVNTRKFIIIIIFIYLPSDVISQVKTATSSRSITKASKYAIPLKPNTQTCRVKATFNHLVRRQRSTERSSKSTATAPS